MPVPTRVFGNTGEQLPRVCFGAMGITSFYANAAEADKSAEIEAQGVEALIAFADAVAPAKAHIDTAYLYIASRPGGRHNEEVVGEAIKKIGRERVFLATKGSFTITGTGAEMKRVQDSTDAGLRAQLAASLARLGVDSVDLFYEHRRDVNVPIEDVAKTFKTLHAEGKIRFAGLSECTASELRRAHAVFPITCVQMEYSLQSRAIEKELIPACRELGVAIVAYSPLGRGMLTATYASADDVPAGDYRKTAPRFGAASNFEKALALKALAEKKGCTTAQLALAWLLSRGDDVFPIPGTKHKARVIENLGAADVVLSAEEVAAIDAAVPEGEGERYAGGWGQFERRT